MKNINNVQNVASSMILAVIPVIIISCGKAILGDKFLNIANIILMTVSYFISAICIYFFNKHISKIKQFRKYKEYEGRWIEIIPDFSRKISICNLYFNDDGYHFDGFNYQDDIKRPVKFKSQKFIENGEDGFFYITKCDLIHRPEGYGKVSFISRSDEGYYKGKGYFLDVSVVEDPKIHNTIMIKFNSSFCNDCLNLHHYENPNEFSERDIYEHVKEYAKKYYDSEVTV